MKKKKIFVKTDISIPEVLAPTDLGEMGKRFTQPLPPIEQTVLFGTNTSKYRSFDFGPWYQVGFDEVTYACQIQISRFLAKQDNDVSVISITAYCRSGLRPLLNYLILRATALGGTLTLADIDRDLIDGFLAHLAGKGTSKNTQKNNYNAAKSVLVALGQRGIINVINGGDNATFPSNPFPNSNRLLRGETALSKKERIQFTHAIRQAVAPIWRQDVLVTSHLLACAMIVVALHTGRNTTPLLEMSRDCLRNHPKDGSVFLVLWKRRGHNTSKVILRGNNIEDRTIESTPTVTNNIEKLIRRAIDLTAVVAEKAPDHLKERVWLFSSNAHKNFGDTVELTPQNIDLAFKKVVADNNLTDADGLPLRLNISRLRKTFGNRIFEILNGDLAATAAALGNSPKVTGDHYLRADEESKRNWRFMGEVLVAELLSNTIGATYKETPVGKCGDPVAGQYAPKQAGATCMNFINCVRCKHYAITRDDLYKLFSFYFRVYDERSRMDKRRWAREYAHIPRLIDQYIVTEGLKRGVFKQVDVDNARERARISPHPFWSADLIANLEILS